MSSGEDEAAPAGSSGGAASADGPMVTDTRLACLSNGTHHRASRHGDGKILLGLDDEPNDTFGCCRPSLFFAECIEKSRIE